MCGLGKRKDTHEKEKKGGEFEWRLCAALATIFDANSRTRRRGARRREQRNKCPTTTGCRNKSNQTPNSNITSHSHMSLHAHGPTRNHHPDPPEAHPRTQHSDLERVSTAASEQHCTYPREHSWPPPVVLSCEKRSYNRRTCDSVSRAPSLLPPTYLSNLPALPKVSYLFVMFISTNLNMRTKSQGEFYSITPQPTLPGLASGLTPTRPHHPSPNLSSVPWLPQLHRRSSTQLL